MAAGTEGSGEVVGSWEKRLGMAMAMVVEAGVEEGSSCSDSSSPDEPFRLAQFLFGTQGTGLLCHTIAIRSLGSIQKDHKKDHQGRGRERKDGTILYEPEPGNCHEKCFTHSCPLSALPSSTVSPRGSNRTKKETPGVNCEADT
jgi:hypothetical protein